MHLKRRRAFGATRAASHFNPTRVHLKPVSDGSVTPGPSGFNPTRVHLKLEPVAVSPVAQFSLQSHKGASETPRVGPSTAAILSLQSHKGASETMPEPPSTPWCTPRPRFNVSVDPQYPANPPGSMKTEGSLKTVAVMSSSAGSHQHQSRPPGPTHHRELLRAAESRATRLSPTTGTPASTCPPALTMPGLPQSS